MTTEGPSRIARLLAHISDPEILDILLDELVAAGALQKPIPEPDPLPAEAPTLFPEAEPTGHFQSRPKRQLVEARRAKRKWDHRDFSMLRTYAREQRDLEEICTLLGRSPQSILTKLRRAMPDLYPFYKHHDVTRPR